ncbi:MAG: histidine kinase [Turicibacter sp.]|nr:histidine kinase [Turicibacter sp.]
MTGRHLKYFLGLDAFLLLVVGMYLRGIPYGISLILAAKWIVYCQYFRKSPPVPVPKNEVPKAGMPEEIKLLALQNQINPHFLYNTLESIRSEALLGSPENAAQMAKLLAQFFRYNISNLEEMVTLGEELSNLHNYFKIQKYRFRERVNMEVFFEGDKEQILGTPLPKLVLQPMVENALLHGIEPLTRPGTITLRFFLYEGLLMGMVSDDGVGMEPSKVQELNGNMVAEGAAGRSIGMENVNRRIQLLFGPQYGVRYYSQPDAGTDVEFSIPVIGGGGQA